MYKSHCYVVCCVISCKESGNIKKNQSRCSECGRPLTKLTLCILNKYYCPSGSKCQIVNNSNKCQLLHPTKCHQSTPYISPCCDGRYCDNKQCLFLHPTKNNTWLVR